MKKYIAFVIIFFCWISTKAQIEDINIGSKRTALGGSFTTNIDNWATFGNQSALGFVENLAVGMFVERKYNINELTSGAFSLVIPMKKLGVLGVSYATLFNSEVYNIQKIGLAYSQKYGDKISAALQFDFFRTTTTEYEGYNSLVAEAGLLYKINQNLNIGFHIFNVSAQKYYKESENRIPTILNFGGNYKFNSKMTTYLELENKINESQINAKMAFEYLSSNKLTLRLGFNTYPFSSSLGLGLNFNQIRMNFALSYHQVLGFSPNSDFNFIKTKKE